MRSFGDVAVAFAKNPLGIFALFLVFTEALAGYTLASGGGAALDGIERKMLVGFIVSFPFCVLLAFVHLVTNHHEKLYAPSEYRDERHFFKKLAPEEQKKRLEEEANDLEQALAMPTHANGGGVAREGDRQFRSLAKGEILMEISLAEDLALRAIEEELGCPVARQVAIPAENGALNLDGAVARGEELVAIEVKYIRSDAIALFQIEHMLGLLRDLKFDRFRRASMILVVVSEASEEQDAIVGKKIAELFERTKVPVTLRMYRANLLKAKFGL